ncbi:AfsR/SARP family transcriptional regulator [Paractinoplanes rishiriensis]|uniref:AfsR/SARP family transcriptional regulator n=1 Tax=Paractinoplanes rishiriensis TaxID=1050105 RepID=UPI001942BCFC|nr:BTAD domain-containing putative transcriptional regulator [Actinoplanes rishiriensis]
MGAVVMVRFGVLGPVEARVGGVPVDAGHARQRCVLAALLVDVNRPVPIDVVLDRVWGDRPPQRARNALAGYLSRLRGGFAQVPGVGFEHRPEGYRVTADPDAVDMHRFRRLVAEARTADGPASAAGLLDEALQLWRGDAFAGLETFWIHEIRMSLDAERVAATLDRNEAWLRLGRHAELLGELARLAGEHPLDERLAGQLMLALYRCDRQADALRHYEVVRARLADELGVDPGPALRALHQRMLTADPSLPATDDRPACRQLPAPPAWFVGRAAELTALDEPHPGMVLHLITGTAGVGKTTLALRWAHLVAHRFADGQLYLNLRGFDPGGSAMPPTEALHVLLGALGVPATQIAGTVAGQTGQLRGLLAGKRMLLVLDNARDADQIRPLLPGSASCTVVVTSRVPLPGLVVGHGGRPLNLDVLNDAECRDLLAVRIGRSRVAAEAEAVREIVARCARLPLALAIVAARAGSGAALRTIAGELSDTAGPLSALAEPDPAIDMRSVLSWSYRALGPAAARLFRRLALHPGPDIGTAAAAGLDGTDAATVRLAIGDLTRAHLLTERVPGRFALHDLLRAYAVELARTVDHEADRHAATRRMLDHYLHTAHRAALALHPHRHPIALPDAPTEANVADVAPAPAWFATEQTVLVRCVTLAARESLDRHAWQLAWTLTDHLDRHGHWQQEVLVHETALAAAHRLGDLGAQAAVHRALGRMSVRRCHYEAAADHYRSALDRFQAAGDQVSAAHTHLGLGWVFEHQDRPAEALDHDRRALALFRAAGHQLGQARSLLHLGGHHLQLDEPVQALADSERALALFREVGDLFGVAATYDNLGGVHHRLGRHEEASGCYHRSLELLRQAGDRYYEAVVLDHLGDLHHATGDVASARDAWKQALSILDEFNHQDADNVRAKLAG